MANEHIHRTWEEGSIPEDWKVGIIITVYKGKGTRWNAARTDRLSC
jgi:hypothetical protein